MTTAKHKLNQWNDSTLIPVIEYKLSNGEYLVVDVSVWNPESNRAKKGFCFDFDDFGLKTRFSGEVKKRGGCFFIEFDDCFSLDEEIQRIDEEITEGFLLPNNLYCCEC